MTLFLFDNDVTQLHKCHVSNYISTCTLWLYYYQVLVSPKFFSHRVIFLKQLQEYAQNPSFSPAATRDVFTLIRHVIREMIAVICLMSLIVNMRSQPVIMRLSSCAVTSRDVYHS